MISVIWLTSTALNGLTKHDSSSSFLKKAECNCQPTFLGARPRSACLGEIVSISAGRLPCRVTVSFPKLELCGGLAISGVVGPVTDHRVLLQTQKSPCLVPPKTRWKENRRHDVDEKACFIGLLSVPLATAPGQTKSFRLCLGTGRYRNYRPWQQVLEVTKLTSEADSRLLAGIRPINRHVCRKGA